MLPMSQFDDVQVVLLPLARPSRPTTGGKVRPFQSIAAPSSDLRDSLVGSGWCGGCSCFAEGVPTAGIGVASISYEVATSGLAAVSQHRRGSKRNKSCTRRCQC